MKIIELIVLNFVSVSVFSQKQKVKTSETKLDFNNLFTSKNQKNISCYRIPAIVTATNEDLIAAIDERVPSCGDLKWNDNINIVIRRSKDSGQTWSDIETLADFPIGQSASDPSMIVDEISGEILLFFNYMDLEREKNIYYLKMMKSKDNGKAWSPPMDITTQITRPDWHSDFKFITSGAGIQTTKGKLVHTLVNLQKGLFLFESTDHGATWSLIPTPILPADESKIVELNDGSWMVNSRVNKEGNRYVYISTDEGKTWISKPDTFLSDPGCNAGLIRYNFKKNQKGKQILLFSNANSRNERTNMTIKVSFDQGKTWSKGKTVYEGSSAYSSMTVLKNGDIGLFFEKDDYKDNVFVRLPMSWVMDVK
jgi:sialidase-1